MGTRLDVALIKSNKSDINAFKDGNTIYITRENLKDGSWAKPVTHETFHFIQNNKAGTELTEFLKSNKDEYKKAKNSVLKSNYGVNEQDIENAFKKLETKENLTEREQKALDEVGATMVENILGNEQSIKRICRENMNFAEKILAKIKDLIKFFTGTSAEKSQLKILKEAERLFNKSLAEEKSTIEKKYKEIEKQAKKLDKTYNEYIKDKKKYLSLDESERESWLKRNGYKASDFNDDVLENNDIQFDKKNNNGYNESDYNSYGWVRSNDVLSSLEWKEFTEKFADSKKRNTTFEKTNTGELIIPVGENGYSGIDNILVFTKGTMSKPQISRIIKINLKNETELDLVREDIFENESKGIQTKNTQLFNTYSNIDKGYSWESYKGRTSSTNAQNNNRIQNRTGSSGKTQFSLKIGVENVSGEVETNKDLVALHKEVFHYALLYQIIVTHIHYT